MTTFANVPDFLPLSATIISNDTGSPTRVEIQNTSDRTVSVFWIDRAGAEIPYAELAPGQSFVTSTFSSHAWKVSMNGGADGFKFYPDVAGRVSVGAAGVPGFTDFSERVSETPLGEWSTAQGYGLINIAKSLGIEDLGYTLPMNGQNNHFALNLVGAPSAWAAGYTGKGVKVAIIDAGMAMHPEVAAQVGGGIDFVDGDNDPSPKPGLYDDHALGVGAIIAGSHTPHPGRDTKGVAPDATLLNVRIGDGNNAGDKIAAGIRWAADNGADVISVPLGSGSPMEDPLFAQAVHYAFERGSVVVIAGGNSSNYGPTGPAISAQSGEAIAVGNLDALASKPFDSSNQPGATPFPWVMASSSGYVPKPDGGYGYHQDGGTSFAGPYVAGLAALLVQQNPNASPSEIIASIIRGAQLGENEATAQAGTGADLAGTDGDDMLLVTGTTIAVDGGAGLDTARFEGERDTFTVAASGDGFTVSGKSLAGGAVALNGVERLVFDDTAIALDIGGNGGMVYRLYQAALGRAPDEVGLGFWINAKDDGQSLDAIAAQFLMSDEAIKLYGAQPTDAALVTAAYQNVLGRAPDAQGFAFWMEELEQDRITPAQLLTSFSESPENQAALIGVIGSGFAYTPFG